MWENNAIKFAFLISFAGHCLLLGGHGFGISTPLNREHPRELKVELDIQKQALLPKVEILGPQKKFRKVEERAALPVKQIKEPSVEKKQTAVPESKTDRLHAEEESAKPLPQGHPAEKIDPKKPDKELMLRYQDMVKQRIEAARRYPLWARKHGVEGTAYINFTVLSGGQSCDIVLIHPSGSGILDQEALSTVKRASPFPPVPQGMGVSSVKMEVAIVFSLNKIR